MAQPKSFSDSWRTGLALPCKSTFKSVCMPLGDEAHVMVRAAIGDEAAADLLVSHPDFHLVKAGRDVQSEGTKERLKEARRHLADYAEKLDADTFITLLDWAYLAVHNGDLDSRDNVGLRAIYDWTREAVAFPALERWIMSNHDADLLKRMGYDPEVPLNTKLAQATADFLAEPMTLTFGGATVDTQTRAALGVQPAVMPGETYFMKPLVRELAAAFAARAKAV